VSKIFKRDSDYSVQAFYRTDYAYLPKNDTEERIVKRLTRYGIKDHQIIILFNKLDLPRLILLMQEVQLKRKNKDITSPYKYISSYVLSNYDINLMEDDPVNTMMFTHSLQYYVGWLAKNNLQWTYINVYARRDPSRGLLTRIYHDQPIPKFIN